MKQIVMAFGDVENIFSNDDFEQRRNQRGLVEENIFFLARVKFFWKVHEIHRRNFIYVILEASLFGAAHLIGFLVG